MRGGRKKSRSRREQNQKRIKKKQETFFPPCISPHLFSKQAATWFSSSVRGNRSGALSNANRPLKRLKRSGFRTNGAKVSVPGIGRATVEWRSLNRADGPDRVTMFAASRPGDRNRGHGEKNRPRFPRRAALSSRLGNGDEQHRRPGVASAPVTKPASRIPVSQTRRPVSSRSDARQTGRRSIADGSERDDSQSKVMIWKRHC